VFIDKRLIKIAKLIFNSRCSKCSTRVQMKSCAPNADVCETVSDSPAIARFEVCTVLLMKMLIFWNIS